MRSYNRRTLARGLATLALSLAFAAGANAQTDFIKADPSNWGIAGYKVTSTDDASTTVEVVSSPEQEASLTFKATGKGMVAEVFMARTKETLTMDASDPSRGTFFVNGKAVATWETTSEQECKRDGFDTLAKSGAYLTLAKSLQDKNLFAGKSSKAAVAGIIPLLGCVVDLVKWCTAECNACTAFYSTTPPPRAGAREPAACGHCFSWYCGDF
jgi:hypothetical protein